MDFDMSDFIRLMETVPPGSHVAISTDQNRVVSFGPDSTKVLEEARSQDQGHSLLSFRPPIARRMCL